LTSPAVRTAIIVSPSYFVGTGAANEWASIGAPPPTPHHELRPNWFEFSVLAGGHDAIGSYVDVAVSAVSYVAPGDLNDDGLFNQLDVALFVTHWRADTTGFNSVAQWMMGDLDNSGLVDLADATLLRNILLNNAGRAFGLTTFVPEPQGLALSLLTIASASVIPRRLRLRQCP
jgi:hypothetical protein